MVEQPGAGSTPPRLFFDPPPTRGSRLLSPPPGERRPAQVAPTSPSFLSEARPRSVRGGGALLPRHSHVAHRVGRRPISADAGDGVHIRDLPERAVRTSPSGDDRSALRGHHALTARAPRGHAERSRRSRDGFALAGGLLIGRAPAKRCPPTASRSGSPGTSPSPHTGGFARNRPLCTFLRRHVPPQTAPGACQEPRASPA